MKINLNCSLCGKNFFKQKNEYNRRIRLGQQRFYCSRKCGGTNPYTQSNISKNWGTKNENLFRGGKLQDEFSAFRPHMRRVRRRKHEYNISLQDLKNQWEAQSGQCVYTKVSLILTGTYEHSGTNPIYLASLDRIDSSKGYIKGNIQWISAVMNYAKSNMSHEQTLNLCEIIKNS